MKVFISQPMRGLTEAEILKTREDIILEVLKTKSEAEFIDNYIHDLPADAHPLLYLGEDIAMMAEADLVILAPGWAHARGCKVEYDVACQYEIPSLVAVRKDDGSMDIMNWDVFMRHAEEKTLNKKQTLGLTDEDIDALLGGEK